MIFLLNHNAKKSTQYLSCISMICIVSAMCYAFSSYLEYRIAAFILLVTVSLIAMLFDILPVLVSAALSALIWDFFFIPPRFTFQISSTEDSLLLLMYFVIASVNGVLTYKIRLFEKLARKKEARANTLRLYNTLLNSLSHELRTPISTIIAATDNLQTDGKNLTATNRDVLVGEIAKASFRLNQQVENLLNMSRLESGFIQPKKDWCDVNETIYQAVRRVEENGIAQKIDVGVSETLPLFKLDKGMLEQIIYNLLQNAILYTPADATVCIEARCEGYVLDLVISDTGPGFPKAEIDSVFDNFYRLKNSRTGGTGLGLSIVKGFTEALGGKISLRNSPTGGAIFTLLIPAEISLVQEVGNE